MLFTLQEMRNIVELPQSIRDQKIQQTYYTTEEINLFDALPQALYQELIADFNEVFEVLITLSSSTTTSFTLEDASEIVVGDYFIFDTPQQVINKVNNTITFDAVLPELPNLSKRVAKENWVLYNTYIRPFYAVSFLKNLSSRSNVQITNSGLVQKALSETSQSADKDLIGLFTEELRGLLTTYSNRMKDYVAQTFSFKRIEVTKNNYISIQNKKINLRPKNIL